MVERQLVKPVRFMATRASSFELATMDIFVTGDTIRSLGKPAIFRIDMALLAGNESVFPFQFVA